MQTCLQTPQTGGQRTTTDAGKYSWKFCHEVGECLRAYLGSPQTQRPDETQSSWHADNKLSSNPPPLNSHSHGIAPELSRLSRLSKGRRKRSSALVHLSEGLSWGTCMQYKFKSHQHINLQEAKARRSLMKRLPCNRRVVICQDSRVNLGSLGKGIAGPQQHHEI